MKLRLWLLIFLATGCSTPDHAQRFAHVQTVTQAPLLPSLAPSFDQLERAVEEEFKASGLPSLVVGIVADGKLVWSKGYGVRDPSTPQPPDSHSVFRIGSITKIFTGLSLLQLRDEGRLDLDAPAARYLPAFAKVVYPTRDSPPITVRHLVTHSSGLPRVGKLDYARADRELTEAELVAALDGVPLEFTPGTKTSYSNLAMGAAGMLIGRVSGMPYTEYVQQHLLAPLGMTHAAWNGAQIDPGHLAAGHKGKDAIPVAQHWRLGAGASMGGLYLDLEDFARFAAFEMSAWPPRDEAESGPMKRSTVRESQMAAGHGLGSQLFGVNWGVSEDSKLGHVVAHTGSTDDYSAAIRLLPRRGLGVIAMTGCGEAERLSGIAKKALEKAFDGLPIPQITLGKGHEQALARIKALLEKPDEVGIQGAFAKQFLSSVPAAKMLEMLRQVQAVGACSSHRVASAEGPKAVVRLTCEKATLELTLYVLDEPPYLLQGFMIKPAP